MKARVIKEWEMYGITHKVGEIMTISLHSPSGLPMISDRDAFLLDNGFIEDMKEPLIKDEKIRKAVRAWAELIPSAQVRYDHSDGRFYTRSDYIVSYSISFPIALGLDETTDYTIAELCGEEEND